MMVLAGLSLALVGASALAQDAEPEPKEAEVDAEAPDEPSVAESEDWLVAIELPSRANALRKAGVPDSDVQETLDAAKDVDLPAASAAEVMQEEQAAVETHGTVDNFGAFVRAKMAEGLRGEALAAAIRAEHEARGKGPRGKYKAKHGKAKQGMYGKAKGKHGKAKGKYGKHGKAKGKQGKGKQGRTGRTPRGDR